MDKEETRAAIVTFLEEALQLAEQLGESPTAYLIERALDEARSQTFSAVPPHLEPLH
jgi:hypothetical protein